MCRLVAGTVELTCCSVCLFVCLSVCLFVRGLKMKLGIMPGTTDSRYLRQVQHSQSVNLFRWFNVLVLIHLGTAVNVQSVPKAA